jgi:glycosyltransferase involved in cell wall biosynthesis
MSFAGEYRPVVLHTRVVAGTGGGPEKTILRSHAYVDPAMVHMAAAYIHPAGDKGIESIRQRAGATGCELYTVAERGPLDMRTVRKMLDLCRKLRVDVWHAHDYKSNLLGLLLRRFYSMKLVTTVHGWTHDTPRTRLYYHVDNRCLPRYDQIIAVSPPLYQHCRNLGIAGDKLTYIPNAIEPADYPMLARDKAHDGQFAIGVVGRLSVEKGVGSAIDLLAALRDRYPQAHLHLVGDGPQRATLFDQALRLDLHNRIHFHGWHDNPKQCYAMMDLLLLPSHTEGLPNVVLEAMASGVPVAATDVGGVRDLLDDGRCGAVLTQDVAAWPNAVAPLIVSRERREQVARLARRRIEQRFSFDKRMGKVLEVYQRVAVLPTTEPLRKAA